MGNESIDEPLPEKEAFNGRLLSPTGQSIGGAAMPPSESVANQEVLNYSNFRFRQHPHQITQLAKSSRTESHQVL